MCGLVPGRLFAVTVGETKADYSVIPPELEVTDVDRTRPGFRIRPHQVDAGQPDRLDWTEEQFAGQHGSNRVDLVALGADGEGFVDWELELDWVAGTGVGGQLGYNHPLSAVGIPGLRDGARLPNEDNAALEVLTFLEFERAGEHTLGVNSTDGFRVQTGLEPRDLFAQRLAEFDGSRRLAETSFRLWVEKAGIYPFRLIWENGSGSAGLEWYSILEDGSRVALNDRGSPAGGLRAYRQRGTRLPYVASVHPAVGTTQAHAQTEIRVSLKNPDNLGAGSVELRLDGQVLPGQSARQGDTLVVHGAIPSALGPGTAHRAALQYPTSDGSTVRREWEFSVWNDWRILPAEVARAPGAGIDPGLRFRVFQVSAPQGVSSPDATIPVEHSWTEAMLAGLAGFNRADLTSFTDNGYYRETGVPNYAAPAVAARPEGGGEFRGDSAIPGIPGPGGSTRFIAAEMLTFVEFPRPGFHLFAVNSRDGFRVTTGHGSGVLPLEVLSPARVAGPVAAVPSVRGPGGAGGIFAPLPVPAIEAELVSGFGNATNAPPEHGCGDALLGAESIRDRIVLITRGSCTFVEKVRNAAAAGARAVIVVNDRADFPIVMGGVTNDVTIPALMISRADGVRLQSAVGARVRLGGDPGQVLGAFNGLREAATTRFGVQVPVAGLYPFRLIWEASDDWGSVEWFIENADGTRVLLNDRDNPGRLNTFRNAREGAPPAVSIGREANRVVVTFSGILQSAPEIGGPFADEPGAGQGGRYLIEPTLERRFFRARQ